MTPNLPFYDAAPGGAGAGVNGPNSVPDVTPKRVCSSPAVRWNAPETSRAAANRISGHTPTQRAAILAFITSRREQGATDAEVSTGIGIPIQSVNPRRGELEALGVIVLNGNHRPTPSGCKARVWVAKEYAPAPREGATP